MAVKKQDSNSTEQIHNNLSYFGGEWQLSASLSRPPVFMKESMLDLFMEETYDGSKTYKTRRLFGDTGGHRLSHDIILVDRTFYATMTSTAGSCAFSSQTAFNQYGIMAANPVYDRRSKPVLYPVIQVWEGNLYTFKNFFNAMDYVPQGSETSRHTSSVSNINRICRQRYFYTKDENGKKSHNGVPTGSDVLFTCGTTFDAFYKQYHKEDGWYIEIGTEKVFFDKELWDKDYSLWFHDPESIKLPYYDRHTSNTSAASTDLSFTTRFQANMVAKQELAGGSIDMLDTDIEYLLSLTWEPQVAAALFTNEEVRNCLTSASGGGTSDTVVERLTKGDLKDLLTKLNTKDSWEALHLKRLSDVKNKLANSSQEFPVELLCSTNSDIMAIATQNSHEGYVVSGTANNAMSYLSSSTSKFNLFEGFFIAAPFASRFLSRRTFIGKALGLMSGTTDDLKGPSLDFSFLEDPTDKITAAKITTTIAGSDEKDPYTNCREIVVPVVLVALNAVVKYIGKGVGTGGVIGTDLLFKGSDTTYVWSEVVGEDFTGLDDKLIEWLGNEKIIVKAPMFADYVENINFAQDLHEDASTAFAEVTAKRSKDKVRLYEDSGIENPYLKQTRSLIDFNKDDTSDTHFSNSFTAVSTGRTPIIPAQYFDRDIDPASVDEIEHDERYTATQHVEPAAGRGNFEGVINSPSIDELWAYLKYLSEDDNADKLPSFTGITSDEFSKDYVSGVNKALVKKRANNRYEDQDKRIVDIIKWKPTELKAGKFSTISGTAKAYTGYSVDEYIEKVFDYKVNFFGRRSNLTDNAVYEYGEDTGYLESLINGIAANFNVLNEDEDARNADLTDGNSFTNTETLLYGKFGDEPTLYQPSEQRVVAARVLDSIVNYHSLNTKHNHFAEYKVNPKNLKTIERNLEQIKQNLMTLAEYTQNTYSNMGYADRGTNRGTLHQLHRNHFEFISTLLEDVNNTAAEDGVVTLKDLTNELNNTEDSLVVKDLDKRVVFDDGQFDTRYTHEDYDRQVIDLSGAVENTRAEHDPYRRNETLLSEVYLAADGTYRSVHEHLVAPVLVCQY